MIIYCPFQLCVEQKGGLQPSSSSSQPQRESTKPFPAQGNASLGLFAAFIILSYVLLIPNLSSIFVSIAQNNGYYCDISHVHLMYIDSISLPSLLPFTLPPSLALLLMPNNPPPPYVLDVFICSLVSTDERKQDRVTFLSLAYFTSHEHIQLHFPGNGMIQSSLLLDNFLLCTWTSSYLSIPLLTHPQADSIFCLL